MDKLFLNVLSYYANKAAEQKRIELASKYTFESLKKQKMQFYQKFELIKSCTSTSKHWHAL